MKLNPIKILIAIGWIFLLISIYIFISLNFSAELLTGHWQLAPTIKYYSAAIQHHLKSDLYVLNIHISTALIMLVTGFFQFNAHFRKKSPNAHKLLGYLYFVSGSISILVILIYPLKSFGTEVTYAAAFTIGLLWFYSGIAALIKIIRKDIASHQLWMTRNYSITIATFFIRPLFVLLLYCFPNLPLDSAFPISFWLCLVISLIISNWI